MEYDEQLVQQVWEKARVNSDVEMNQWREDECGAWIAREHYGDIGSNFGWIIINVSAGGALVAIRRSLPLFSQVSVEIPTAPFASSEAFPQAVRLLPAQIIRLTHGEGHHLMGLKFAAPIDGAMSDRRGTTRKTASSM